MLRGEPAGCGSSVRNERCREKLAALGVARRISSTAAAGTPPAREPGSEPAASAAARTVPRIALPAGMRLSHRLPEGGPSLSRGDQSPGGRIVPQGGKKPGSRLSPHARNPGHAAREPALPPEAADGNRRAASGPARQPPALASARLLASDLDVPSSADLAEHWRPGDLHDRLDLARLTVVVLHGQRRAE